MSTVFLKKGVKMKKILFLVLFLVMLFCSCGVQEQSEIIVNKEETKFVGAWMNYNEIGDLLSDVKDDNELILKLNSIYIFTHFMVRMIQTIVFIRHLLVSLLQLGK